MPALTALPVTARLQWQLAALATAPGLRVLLAGVPPGGGGLDGYALLSCRDDSGTLRIAIPRPGSDDSWGIAARTPPARQAVLRQLAAAITAAGPPWQAEITGITDQITAEQLARLLPGAQVDSRPGVPGVQLRASDGRAGFMLPAGIRKTLRRGAAHLSADGVTEDIQFTRDAKALVAMMPDIQAAHLRRDTAPDRDSDLDRPGALAFWQFIYRHYAARGELEVGTLGIGGHLAAYVVAILDLASDPPAYRVLDGRIAAAWKRYYPGIRLEAALLGHVLADGRFDCVDWMSRRHPRALLMADGTAPRTWEVRAAA